MSNNNSNSHRLEDPDCAAEILSTIYFLRDNKNIFSTLR